MKTKSKKVLSPWFAATNYFENGRLENRHGRFMTRTRALEFAKSVIRAKGVSNIKRAVVYEIYYPTKDMELASTAASRNKVWLAISGKYVDRDKW